MSLKWPYPIVRLLFLAAVVLNLQTAPLHAAGETWTGHFSKQITRWIEDLAGKDKQFEQWKEADTNVQPLGPNSRQWLVSLTKAGKQVGYLVVGEAEGTQNTRTPTLVLLEYGLGEYILFDDAFAPKQVSAEPVYDGFASYWLIAATPEHPELIDAKTGEKYPSMAKRDAPVMDTLLPAELIGQNKRLIKLRTIGVEEQHPFDQIDWLTTQPLAENDPVRLLATLWSTRNENIVVAASLFQEEVLAPFRVGSLHLWDQSTAYVGVWDQGLRFLPLPYLQKVGRIMVNQ